MSLPKVDEKVYSCILPLSKKKINFKPFKVKEQKHFLMEIENDNNKETKYKIIYNIVKKCCSEENIDEFYTVDFDYLFFQIRKYSIGVKIELNFTYKKEDEKIDEKVKIDIDIDNDIKVSEIEDDVLKTTLKCENMIINMEQLKIKNFLDAYDKDQADEDYLLARTLKSVEKNGELYNDFIIEDAKDFLESLSSIEYGKVTDFLKKNPRLYFDKKIILEKSGKELDLSKYNYTDFFFSL